MCVCVKVCCSEFVTIQPFTIHRKSQRARKSLSTLRSKTVWWTDWRMSSSPDKRQPSPSLSRPNKPKSKGAKPSSKRTGSSKTSGASSSASGADSNAFRVAVRCRPLLPHERAKESGVLELSKGAVTVKGVSDETAAAGADRAGAESPRASPRRERSDASLKIAKTFSFDHVYDEFSTQDEVYEQLVAPFTAKYLAGYNVTLFAYGQVCGASVASWLAASQPPSRSMPTCHQRAPAPPACRDCARGWIGAHGRPVACAPSRRAQTGTGKTHTVIGGEAAEDRGVVPRFVEAVFAHTDAEAARAAADAPSAPSTRRFTEAEAADAPSVLSETRVERLGVTILEVYEGKVYDLLAAERGRFGSERTAANWVPHGTPLPLELEPSAPGRAAADGTRCYWVRGGERAVGSAAEALEALTESLRLRHTASHALNAESSRSHCIFSLQVHRRRDVYKLERVDKQTWRYMLQPGRTAVGVTRANLVDLAGSEDARETCANGATLREAADINKSLFTLRKAIEHLALRKHTCAACADAATADCAPLASTRPARRPMLASIHAARTPHRLSGAGARVCHGARVLSRDGPQAFGLSGGDADETPSLVPPRPGLLRHDRHNQPRGCGRASHAQHARLRRHRVQDSAGAAQGV